MIPQSIRSFKLVPFFIFSACLCGESQLCSQTLQFGWLLPDATNAKLPTKDIAYLPEEGINLYDKPNGEHIGRLGRDPRSRDYPNYYFNIFLSPRDRTPELLPREALAPLADNCFAVPFVKQENGFVLLFSKDGPYYYWASVKELTEQHYYLSDRKKIGNAVQVPSSNTENRTGLILPDFEKLPELPRTTMAYVPGSGLALYDRPGGKVWAKLSRFCPVGKYTDGSMRMFILPDSNPNNCEHIKLEQLHHLSDDTYGIPFYNRVDNYVLLFKNTSQECWVDVKDIAESNFRMLGWKEYFIERRDLPAHVNEPGLNLREGPYADAKKLLTVKGDEMEIILTGFDGGFCEGPWCKVKVKVYKKSPCTTSEPESKNLKKEYEGWIKLVDDNGMPNVHINTKGC